QVSPAGSAPPAVRIQSAEEIEQSLWNSIKDEREPAVFDEYLKQYPKGRYAPQAKVLLAKLRADNRAPAPAVQTPAPAPPASSEDPETALWTAVGQGNSADDYGVYLKQYPKGKYVALARQRLQKLKDDAKQQADAADQAAWQAAERTGTEAAYLDYQRMYPNGNYSALVAARLIKAKNTAGQREEEAEWQKAQESATRAAMQAYIARYPNGKYVAQARLKDAEYQRVPARPNLPFAVDDAVWRTLEGSEMYRNFPRPRAIKTSSAYSDTLEYTGAKSRTLTPPAPAGRTKETEFSPLGDKCVIHRMKMHYTDLGKNFGDNNLTYACGGVFLGSTADGKVNAGLRSLGPISGSLYPPRIGAEQRVQHEMAYMPDRKFDSRTTTHCQITGRIEASQLHSRLTGKAWAVRCRSEMAWIGGHDGKPIVNDNEDYILEDLGARASELGVLNMLEKRFVIPVPGY
ncbi:MAG TPA: hypothetical protein PLW86_18370, partial [Rhodocyclaceae bacterium]|nr:hypothetical protein [Rhodocyclaceae bacterium]